MRLGDQNAALARDESEAEMLANSVISELLSGSRQVQAVSSDHVRHDGRPGLDLFDHGRQYRLQRARFRAGERLTAIGGRVASGPLRTGALDAESGLCTAEYEQPIIDLEFVVEFVLWRIEQLRQLRK